MAASKNAAGSFRGFAEIVSQAHGGGKSKSFGGNPKAGK